MKKQVKILTDDELNLRKRKLKNLRILVIIFDVFAFGFLIWQLRTNNFSYMPYVMLLLCNFITFFAKPTM